MEDIAGQVGELSLLATMTVLPALFLWADRDPRRRCGRNRLSPRVTPTRRADGRPGRTHTQMGGATHARHCRRR